MEVTYALDPDWQLFRVAPQLQVPSRTYLKQRRKVGLDGSTLYKDVKLGAMDALRLILAAVPGSDAF